MAAPFDVDSMEVTGEPVRVATLDGINDFAVTPDGTLIYFQPPQSSGLVWRDRQGEHCATVEDFKSSQGESSHRRH